MNHPAPQKASDALQESLDALKLAILDAEKVVVAHEAAGLLQAILNAAAKEPN